MLERIPKTIVFIDGRNAIAEAVAYIQGLLVGIHEKYTTNRLDEQFCVQDIIETYTAHVAEHDRELRYNQFKRLDSKIRIIFATTSLGMGINVSDVSRVVLWGFPIGKDLGDFWQRIGRGGRGKDIRSTAYIFLPY
ncbi:hypothetical protein EG327_006653 [Venturia inaequalis]|uniref:DNA 3'-5' helicase n=1 Tax=Venturia inaequalis TaxID=5025 RepID=A0A8H3V180_VENIN|nr:hypothetical protein EG327_006653 [Venturia inaequalis]